MDGLDAATLNARPGDESTNSVAVLATHAMHSTRLWLSLAVGASLPRRDRPAEFAASVTGPQPLLEMIDTFGADCIAALDSAAAVDWSAIRLLPAADGTTTEVIAAWALVHAIDHLRGHADETALTRNVLLARR